MTVFEYQPIGVGTTYMRREATNSHPQQLIITASFHPANLWYAYGIKCGRPVEFAGLLWTITDGCE